ncbi:hypothetical protein AAG570_006281 [Ranatra chinensis]|uniref:Uncharacterized protein n=1 Tax=Ranatra chinensis TaxID=642074 RepID=A0ABD0YTI4_9HEMI
MLTPRTGSSQLGASRVGYSPNLVDAAGAIVSEGPAGIQPIPGAAPISPDSQHLPVVRIDKIGIREGLKRNEDFWQMSVLCFHLILPRSYQDDEVEWEEMKQGYDQGIRLGGQDRSSWYIEGTPQRPLAMKKSRTSEVYMTLCSSGSSRGEEVPGRPFLGFIRSFWDGNFDRPCEKLELGKKRKQHHDDHSRSVKIYHNRGKDDSESEEPRLKKKVTSNSSDKASNVKD